MARRVYRLLLWCLLPLVMLRLWWRGLREPGYRTEIGERFGRYRAAFELGGRPLIWLHAVSMGETRAAELLVRALAERHPGATLLVTHMTATGRQTALQLFADMPRVVLAWLPYDYPFAVRSFLRRFRPQLGILMETEVWPNLVRACEEQRVPLLLSNARMSEKSARGYALAGDLVRDTFGRLSAIAAQTEADAERLAALGARRAALQVAGNLKFDVAAAAPAGPGAEPGRALRARFGARPVFLAASTREGEELLLLEALREAAGLPSDVLVVIVPRHPQRFRDVGALFERLSLRYVRRSEKIDVPADCRYVLGDSLGEMAAYYAAADCAFVGGSLLQLGGQNLIEACAAGVPVLIGPHTHNFAQAAEEAVAAGAAVRLADARALVREAGRLLGDASARDRMRQAGLAFCRQHRGATERVVTIVESLLDVRAS
ncbi:MAG: 3-deoxy-D-manno-octulosonic acid transferase [Betaproteobacteria bacterium]|nr:3-deoxy-D-manno-octulosonic acid transferase [Betaproteobacteria bacterium]